MSTPATRSAAVGPQVRFGETLRVAFVGPTAWVDSCAPTESGHGLSPRRMPVGAARDIDPTRAALDAFQPHVVVLLDPPSLPIGELLAAPALTLGVLVAGVPPGSLARALGSLDRLVSFDPVLTGTSIGASRVWRAIPPPVSDTYFADVRPLHGAPRAVSVGRSSEHREAMLMPVKHHHDLLQVLHGVSGQALRELLDEYDVGVYVAPDRGGGFGPQVGMHLAAGHLLLAEALNPAHGLERDIDYLQVESPDGLVWVLDRLRRFPEMHHGIRVRGRRKAEQYRASRLFKRLAYDLLADVSAFGRSSSRA
jgi:hypothetical protein